MVSTLSIWARIPNHTYHKNIHFVNAPSIGIFMNSEKYTHAYLQRIYINPTRTLLTNVENNILHKMHLVFMIWKIRKIDIVLSAHGNPRVIYSTWSANFSLSNIKCFSLMVNSKWGLMILLHSSAYDGLWSQDKSLKLWTIKSDLIKNNECSCDHIANNACSSPFHYHNIFRTSFWTNKSACFSFLLWGLSTAASIKAKW